MKKLFLVLLWVVISACNSFLYSQQQYDYVQQAGLNAAIFRGPEAVKYKFIYQGTPYAYSENFAKGTVVYNGVRYNGVELNLNAHKDELHLRIPSSGIVLELDRTLVGEFSIGRRNFVTLLGEDVPQGLVAGYYEVLYNGKDVLLKKNVRMLYERLQTSGKGVFRHFDPVNRFYVVRDGSAMQISRNKDFAKIYKVEKKSIKTFIKKNKLRFVDMEEKDPAFVEIMQFIDNK